LFNRFDRVTAIWYLNDNIFISGAYGPTLPVGWELVAVGDFNLDGHPDYVLFNSNLFSLQTGIWYLNNNVLVSAGYGPTLPSEQWRIAGTADFNSDGHPDYLLFNRTTSQTAIWYMSGRTRIGGAYGPTIASGYQLKGAADYNGDGHPDYALFNPTTLQTQIWYLNNNVFVSAASGPTLPSEWRLVLP
jgi:VCBS repeat protein